MFIVVIISLLKHIEIVFNAHTKIQMLKSGYNMQNASD